MTQLEMEFNPDLSNRKRPRVPRRCTIWHVNARYGAQDIFFERWRAEYEVQSRYDQDNADITRYTIVY